MKTVVVLPNPFDLESEAVVVEEFDSYEEAEEWAQDFLNLDEDGKLQVLVELDEVESESFE
jgi:hypothetical protein